ncbi:GDP-mannose 4,6-dehydratase [Aeromicrobium stalagmiti]|uniref:GDP-mannose 4,6-dehydratase n=1 Tax=Aeromicrobium stalagmiti TaxID=2738988 RepID=UPI0015696DD5|nr:GDP-mannose 4,6-dehydratase [Aeromicrobium stalagmiti]NRQ49350.1 GDP-mannose 4,6-dehydratase [Aeromicrobium stalagmiti]
MKRALVTGLGGQDGTLLARHLRSLDYDVVGTLRPGSHHDLAPYLDAVTVVEHELDDVPAFAALLDEHEPHEVYNLAGITSVGRGWSEPELTRALNEHAVEGMLRAMLAHGERTGAPVRFFQASTSEVFGPGAVNPQDEQTPHAPAHPYAESKSRAQLATAAARERHGLFACAGILYNHESPLRRVDVVTRKVTRAAARIAQGSGERLTLGNLDSARDWGAATDYVRAMHAALQHDEPMDYVIATGRLHTIRELVELAFAAAGLDDAWQHVDQDPALLRKVDAPGLCGDAGRARDVLGWEPSVSFEQLVRDMVAVDLLRVRTGIEHAPAHLEGSAG